MRQLEEVLVDDLPWLYKPFRCGHYSRVEWLLDAEEPGDAQAASYCGEMLGRLRSEEVAECPFHTVDWRLVAGLAVSLHRVGLNPGSDPFHASALEGGAGEDELSAVRSFWIEPISWQRGQASVSNGQHRCCALKLSGATRALIEAR